MTEPDPFSSEQAIVNHFQELRNELSQISTKANDLAAESREHGLVLGALEHLDGGRKCYRVVGDVLVERTVAEVKPAVQGNKEQLDLVVGQLVKQINTKKMELTAFQEKYKIRIKGEDEQSVPAAPQQSSKGSQGVLVQGS